MWSRLKISPVGRINLIKIILKPQILYILHNSPMVVPLKQFCIINSIFRSLILHNSTARVKLEQLQRPKEAGGLALPNPWLYYLALQLQHIARVLGPEKEPVLNLVDSTAQLLRIATGGRLQRAWRHCSIQSQISCTPLTI